MMLFLFEQGFSPEISSDLFYLRLFSWKDDTWFTYIYIWINTMPMSQVKSDPAPIHQKSRRVSSAFK